MVSDKAIRQAIYERLNVAAVTSLLANGSASLHHAVAPPTGAYPLLVFNKQADTSTLRMGGNAFDSHLWLVKAVARGTSSSAAEDIDKAARDRLDFAQFTITGGVLMHLARESGVSYLETAGDTQYRHHGALYRLVVGT
jgi:hypothetical protein